MYEFVRRQQELQPNVFASKTFQWMDGSLRESSWVKLYSRNIPTDPLAQSSSSLFLGPRSQSKPGVLQRSAGGLAPHLFTFRRHRQSSETTPQPPSGASGAFWPRRRGFTMPSSSQPPPSFEDGPPEEAFPQRERGATVAELGTEAAANPHAPINAAIMPHPVPAASGSAQEIRPDAPTALAEIPRLSSPLVYPAHQLQSSFSPPQSPRARTICHRARELMKRVRSKKQGTLQQPSSPNPLDRGPPFTISSVLCTADRTPPIAHSRVSPLMGPAQVPPQSLQTARRSPKPAPHNLSAHALPGGRQTRALPRSPLANPVVLTAIDPEQHTVEDKQSAPYSPVHGSAKSAAMSTPRTAESSSSSSSSDEEGRVCRVCSQYKSTEWVVECDSAHALCFGCVQAHVKQLLANTKVYTVVCPSGSCAASISTKHLRACLPPHRLQQLVTNRRRNDRSSGLIKRSISMCTRWNSTDSAGRASRANLDDSGFDAPIITVTEPQNNAVRRAGAVVMEDVQSVANRRFEARNGTVDPQRFSASMPVLHPGNDVSPGSSDSGQLLSELTSVEPGSVDSVVLAASVAADSAATLSPESVGSRLRRVPKGREPLSPQLDAIDLNSPNPQPQNTFYDLPAPGQRAAMVHSMYESRQATPPPPHQLHQHVSPDMSDMSGSPVSWQPPSRVLAGRATTKELVAPPLPPPLSAAFRASATWITPGQRYSGYTENLLLNATLFETIRRMSPDGDGDGDDGDGSVLDYLPMPSNPPAGQRPPIPEIMGPPADDDAGVYIPTWRRPSGQQTLPLWADAQYGMQSGVLSEAAELNFDLYETLHRRR